jgi:hypothetical protein
MAAVNVLVLTGYGLNCDHETAYVSLILLSRVIWFWGFATGFRLWSTWDCFPVWAVTIANGLLPSLLTIAGTSETNGSPLK